MPPNVAFPSDCIFICSVIDLLILLSAAFVRYPFPVPVREVLTDLLVGFWTRVSVAVVVLKWFLSPVCSLEHGPAQMVDLWVFIGFWVFCG